MMNRWLHHYHPYSSWWLDDFTIVIVNLSWWLDDVIIVIITLSWWLDDVIIVIITLSWWLDDVTIVIVNLSRWLDDVTIVIITLFHLEVMSTLQLLPRDAFASSVGGNQQTSALLKDENIKQQHQYQTIYQPWTDHKNNTTNNNRPGLRGSHWKDSLVLALDLASYACLVHF